MPAVASQRAASLAMLAMLAFAREGLQKVTRLRADSEYLHKKTKQITDFEQMLF